MSPLPRWTAFAWLKFLNGRVHRCWGEAAAAGKLSVHTFWGGMSLRLEVTLPDIRSSILPSPAKTTRL